MAQYNSSGAIEQTIICSIALHTQKKSVTKPRLGPILGRVKSPLGGNKESAPERIKNLTDFFKTYTCLILKANLVQFYMLPGGVEYIVLVCKLLSRSFYCIGNYINGTIKLKLYPVFPCCSVL